MNCGGSAEADGMGDNKWVKSQVGVRVWRVSWHNQILILKHSSWKKTNELKECGGDGGGKKKKKTN